MGFRRWGEGKDVEPETVFERRVLQDAAFFDAYGCPFDPRRLPAREHEAHMAVLSGKQQAREKEQKKAQRQQRTAGR